MSDNMTPSNDRAAIWAVVMLTGMALCAVTALAVVGKPLDSVIQVIVMLVPTTVGSLFTLLRVESIRRDMTTVKDQTNGNMTKLLDKLPDQPRE